MPLPPDHPLLQVSPEQSEKLQKLKTIIHEDPSVTDDLKAWCSDLTLFRYLEAREWSLKKAEAMLRNTLTWRAKYQPDKITPADVIDQCKVGSGYINSVDKAGRPIMWMRVRKTPPGVLASKFRFFVFILENLSRAMDEENGVYQGTWFVDFRDYSSTAKNLEIGFTLDCLRTMQNHYPERLGHVVCYDTPWIFNALWAIISRIMSKRTSSKVSFVTGKPEKKLAALRQLIPDEGIEAEFGGENSFVWSYESYWEPRVLAAIKEREELGGPLRTVDDEVIGVDPEDVTELPASTSDEVVIGEEEED